MIVYDKGQHENTIYGLWERNFHDPIPYARFYFECVYPKNQVILWQDSQVIKGMIHWNPYEINLFGKTLPATYIVGVATDEEYRREGVMRKLLRETFLELRNRGQSITYLMPADENYYLPFDFRYGMSQIEQEIYIDSKAEPDISARWKFETEVTDEKTLENISNKENEVRNQLFDLHTKVNPDYLRQINEEAKGDFARLLYVFVDGEYVGRCVMGTEDSYMTLSQIMCVKTDIRAEFLKILLAYGEKQYHYGAYKVITDTSWESTLLALKEEGSYRMPPIKHTPIIMFRILDVENFVQKIKAKEEKEIQIYIADTHLPVQSGRYIWKATKDGGSLRKYKGEDIADGGKISIGDLVDVTFADGVKKKKIHEMEGLSEAGKSFMENLLPIREVCITEIV